MRNWIWCLLLLLIASASHAGNSLFLSLGPNISYLNNSQDLAINSIVTNRYETNKRIDVNVMTGIGVAHSFENILNHHLKISLGLAGYFIPLGQVKGTVYPFVNDGSYDPLRYQFKADSKALLVEARFFYVSDSTLYRPYILLGAGKAWNSLSDYNEVPTGSAAATPLVFSDHKNRNFAYELGLGVQRNIYIDSIHGVKYSASLDYRYFSLNKANLGGFPALTTGQRLQIDRVGTHSFMFSIIAAI